MPLLGVQLEDLAVGYQADFHLAACHLPAEASQAADQVAAVARAVELGHRGHRAEGVVPTGAVRESGLSDHRKIWKYPLLSDDLISSVSPQHDVGTHGPISSLGQLGLFRIGRPPLQQAIGG